MTQALIHYFGQQTLVGFFVGIIFAVALYEIPKERKKHHARNKGSRFANDLKRGRR